MVTAEEAKSIILRLCEGSSPDERFAIQSCEPSPSGDYWVVRANSEDFVVHGVFERCYVGVNAHLVKTASGAVETVGSGQSVEQYLEDKYDLERAAGSYYVLQPSFDKTDKVALINLRQKLGLSLQESIALLSMGRSQWLTGKRSVLKHAQDLLCEQGIEVDIVLRQDVLGAVEIDERAEHLDALKPYIRA